MHGMQRAAHDGMAPDSGDTAFIIMSGVLVLMMTLPGLMLFYGALIYLGAARAKHRGQTRKRAAACLGRESADPPGGGLRWIRACLHGPACFPVIRSECAGARPHVQRPHPCRPRKACCPHVDGLLVGEAAASEARSSLVDLEF